MIWKMNMTRQETDEMMGAETEVLAILRKETTSKTLPEFQNCHKSLLHQRRKRRRNRTMTLTMSYWQKWLPSLNTNPSFIREADLISSTTELDQCWKAQYWLLSDREASEEMRK